MVAIASGAPITTAIVIVILLALLGAVALAVTSATRRARRRISSRPCPRCGRRVDAGVLDCRACGFDFRQVGA